MGSSVIFSGNDVKTLKSNIDLNGNAKILSGSTDPTSSATSAPIGSVYLNTSNGNLYRKIDAGSSTNWVKVTSGASGINYITNPDAEANITGFNAYANAAGTSPVNGTGGSPTTTVTRTTSSPLRGVGSFLITKDAANRQGEGVSTDFTIDRADQAKILGVSFDYEIASGTFASGDSSDLRMWIYDVTNSVLIPLAPFTIQGNVGQFKFSGVFQTASNSTSYRLIWHIATTSASAWTFKVDNVSVGPQTYQYGAPIGDWTSYTPTVSNLGTGGSSTITGKYRRVGDSMELQIFFVKDGSGGSGASVVNFSLPSGYTIDSTKTVSAIGNDQTLGEAMTYRLLAAGQYDRLINIYPFSSTTVALTKPATNGAYVGSDIVASAQVTMNLRVPITGWSSTVVMSNDTDTRVVAASYGGTPTGTLTNSYNKVTFPTIDYDTHSAYSSGTYTVPVSGYYRCKAHVEVVSTLTSGQAVSLGVYKNGSQYKTGTYWQYVAVTGATVWCEIDVLILFTAGDTVDFRVIAQGSSQSYAYGYMNIERTSGPSSVAMTETVAAKYGVSSLTVGTAFATKICSTKEFDTHGAYSTSTGVFTCPVSGIYRVTDFATCNATSSSAIGGAITSALFKNGTEISELGHFFYQETGTSFGPVLNGSALVKCVAGDTLEVRVARSATVSSFALDNGSSIWQYSSFEKIDR